MYLQQQNVKHIYIYGRLIVIMDYFVVFFYYAKVNLTYILELY